MSTTSDLAALPNPQHLTLLFKHHKSTTLLSVLPSDTLSYTKERLLAVLRSRNLTTFPGTSTPLPSTPDDLQFGILVDRREPRKGWIYAEDRANLSTKKKGKKGTEEGEVEAMGELDLKDGGWVAYRLRRDKNVADLVDEGLEDMEVDQAADGPGEWNVVVASYDDEDEEHGRDEEQGEDEEQGGDGEQGRDEDDSFGEIRIPKPRNMIAS